MADKKRLEIARAEDNEESLWLVTLFDGQNNPRLLSTNPLDKGPALDAAKVLKHEGAKATVLLGKPEPDYTGWVLTSEKSPWVIKLTPIAQTGFAFADPKYQTSTNEDEIKRAMEEIENLLELAEIHWNPPDEDPVIPYSDIETPTKGHPGS